MSDDLLNASLTNFTGLIAAVGGLGTAAYGLVDASKAVAGGMSNPGFGYVRKAVEPLVSVGGAFGKDQILATLRANWLNGVAKADQKAIAKSLIRVGLTPENAPALATATGVDKERLATAAQKVRSGQPLVPQDVNIFGEFDVVVSAILDLGYERADQLYRNAAKLAAALVAVVLAVIGGGLVFHAKEPALPITDYFGSPLMVLAVVIGAMSTPLAPVAKDLSSSLAAAVKAVNAVKR
jgi:hypothetical protein